MTAQSPAGPQPRTIQITWMATFVAAAFSVLAPLTYFSARSWIEQQQINSINKNTAHHSAAQVQTDLDNVAHNVSKALPIQLIFGVIVAAILVVIALKVREGRHWTRWGLVGVWVLVTLTGYSPVGLGGLVTLGSSAPAQVKLTSFLGAGAFAVALIAVNLPASVLYLNANRPPRPAGAPAGGGLGGLFRPRQMTPPTSQPTKPASARTTQPAKPAPARTTKPAQSVQRTKAKTRPASTEPTGQAPPASPGPKSGGTGRNRGKSRGR